MTTRTDHWKRGTGWVCPLCGRSLHSPEMLGIHVSLHEGEAKRVRKWREYLESNRAESLERVSQ